MTKAEVEKETAPEPKAFGVDELNELLHAVFRSVVQNLNEVRAKTLSQSDAADRDDAFVRVMARVLMNEDERFRTELPKVGADLVTHLRADLPALFEGVAETNPRALMVRVGRAYLQDVYGLIRELMRGEELPAEALSERIEGLVAIWLRRLSAASEQ